MDNKKTKIKGFIWVYIIGIIVVIGGVMAYGLIGSIVFDLDRNSAISMLGMIPLMSLIYFLAMRPVVKRLSERMEKLFAGMNEVSEGNLDYQIDLQNAGEYKALYKQFNDMTMELKKTKEEMEAFSNEFAHEFKTPITAISGFADILTETGEDIETKERMEYLKMIQDESRRLLHLSQNTLLLSKMEAMQVVVEKEDLDLAEQIRQCLILLSKSLDEKNIEIDMDEDLSLQFNGNRELLQHIWINLINNAIKFTPEGGTIAITGKKDDARINISIADTGIGMDEETVSHIFEKYYQNDPVSLTKGSGIGLAIVKRIVDLCGGEITVSSWLGTGSKFTIILPI